MITTTARYRKQLRSFARQDESAQVLKYYRGGKGGGRYAVTIQGHEVTEPMPKSKAVDWSVRKLRRPPEEKKGKRAA